MSLIWFHRLLITAAIIFCLGFAAWELRAFAGDGGALELLLALAFFVAGAALAYYLKNLRRFLGTDD